MAVRRNKGKEKKVKTYLRDPLKIHLFKIIFGKKEIKFI